MKNLGFCLINQFQNEWFISSLKIPELNSEVLDTKRNSLNVESYICETSVDKFMTLLNSSWRFAEQFSKFQKFSEERKMYLWNQNKNAYIIYNENYWNGSNLAWNCGVELNFLDKLNLHETFARFNNCQCKYSKTRIFPIDMRLGSINTRFDRLTRR